MFRGLKRIFGKNRFAFIALLFFMLDIGYYFLLRSLGIGGRQAMYESLTSFILILFFSFILQRIHKYYHSRSAITTVHISIIFIFSFLSAVFLQEYGKWIGVSDVTYMNFLVNAFYFRWFLLFLVFLTVVNQLWIEKHLQEQSKAFARLIEKERQLASAEINNLQQQFQPHFLFNSLNSIGALIKSQPEKARSMIHNLSDFLRLTIQKSKDEFISIQQELDYLNLYLAIEKVRFGHRLNIQIEMQETCSEMVLPSLLLQPIVENAIKYGVYGNIGELTITISISCSDNLLRISITNPYDPLTVSSSKGTGFGLESINRKLTLFYNRTDLLQTEKTDQQFTTHVQIPQV